jgi:hypothetical protein
VIDPNFSDQEKKLLRILAKRFTENKNLRSPLRELQEEGLEVDQQSLDQLLAMMVDSGAIVNGTPTSAEEFRMVTITIKAVQMVREMDEAEKEQGDFVDKIKESARKNRFTSLIIIGSIVLAAVLTIANQAIQLLQNLGWMVKP